MKYKLVNEIKKKGFPTSSKKYPYAHRKANEDEKKKYPKGYEKMKKIDNKLKKGELAGTHLKSGEIDISKKVPKPERKETVYHEVDELIRMEKKKEIKNGRRKSI